MNTDKHGLKGRLLSAFICVYLWPKLFFFTAPHGRGSVSGGGDAARATYGMPQPGARHQIFSLSR
jgi:hypothetical protein